MRVSRVAVREEGSNEVEYLYFTDNSLAANAFLDYMKMGYHVQYMLVDRPLDEAMGYPDVEWKTINGEKQ